ncbi:MAG TPA: DsrE/DsrF/DrsH-like family protein, partial [Propionibacteriaceae bacterium]|nr:DsrE/DsrF/DrsH-like family protein [Propionibacteriaceae bacterium]
KFTMLGNTAMHMPQAPNLPLPSFMGAIPGVTKYATNMMKQQIADLEIPEVPEMIDTIKAMGGHLWGCRMSFDMNKLTEEDLYDDIDGIISASDFMEISDGGQIIFI